MTLLGGVQEPRDVAGATEALARLGVPALPDLFAFLVSGAATGTGDEQVRLDPLRRVALECALARLPRPELTGFLTRLSRQGASEPQRVTALEVLGRTARKGDLVLCLELGSPAQDALPGPELKRALRATLAAVAEREPGVPRALCGLFARTPPVTRPAILEVVQEHAGADAPTLLGGLLGTAGPEADGLVLATLARPDPPRAGPPGSLPDSFTRDRVRAYLGQPDRSLAVLACSALERLRDQAAVPQLIALLGSSDRNLSACAHRTLVALTGMALNDDPQLWMAWLDRSLIWWDERADACSAAIRGPDAAQSAQAILEAAGQRLYLDQVVEILLPGLQRPEPDQVRLTCRALRSIRTPAVEAALEELLQHRDPAVVEEARRGLARLHTAPSTSSRRLALTLRR